MGSFTITTKGFKELDDILKTMPDKLARKALVKAVGDGMRVVRDQAASNIGRPKSTMAMSNTLNKKTGWLAQSLLGLEKKHWPIKFWEAGTKPRYTKKTKAYRGQIKATHWFSSAFDSKWQSALEKMKDVLGAQIDKLWSGK